MPANEPGSISALVTIFNEMIGLLRSILETTASNNAALLNRPTGHTGRLEDAAQERGVQWQQIQAAKSDRAQLAGTIGTLARRMDKFEDTQREILWRVTPWWQRRKKWWRVTRGKDDD
jgi:hypothetical protein